MGMISPKIDHSTKYDIETGLSSTRYARRFVARRARWILGVVLAAGIVVYFSDLGGGLSHSTRLVPGPPDWQGEAEGDAGELEDIWEEGAVGEEEEGEGSKGWGWGFGLPFGKSSSISDTTTAITTTPIDGEEREGEEEEYPVLFDDYIAPMHPNLALLPSPSSLFPEVTFADFLAPPEIMIFPDERLREIISEPPPETPTSQGLTIPPESFSQTWVGPENWDGPRSEMRRAQWEGFARGREGWESEAQKVVREERRDAVRRGFAWAWQAYKDYAWGGWSASFWLG